MNISTAAETILRDHGIAVVPDTDEPGYVAANAVSVALARSVVDELEAAGVVASWSPDCDDATMAWLYVR